MSIKASVLKMMFPPPTWVLDWFAGNDHGLSSETIACYMLGIPPVIATQRIHSCHPRDGGDFGRCMRLLDLADDIGADWRKRLPELADLSEEWKVIVENWAELEALYREDREADREYRRLAFLRKDGGRRVHRNPATPVPVPKLSRRIFELTVNS